MKYGKITGYNLMDLVIEDKKNDTIAITKAYLNDSSCQDRYK